MKLDLGDTYHGDTSPLKPGWTAIELRPRHCPGKIQGDFEHLPFADGSITYAYGACFLAQTIDELRISLRELFRVLKPGANVSLSCCEEFDSSTHLAAFIHSIRPAIEDAGFVIDDWTYDDHPDYKEVTLEELTLHKGDIVHA